MKRYYYSVGEFQQETEADLVWDQEDNDIEFLNCLFEEYKLDPKYPERERIYGGMHYIGHLDYQLYNWEGDKIKWLVHTIELFQRKLELIIKTNPGIKKKDYVEVEYILKWLGEKLTSAQSDSSEPLLISTDIPPENKIRWLGKPAEFGFLFKELADKGWIQIPATNSGPSIRKLAKLCFNYFDTGTESFDSLYNEFTKIGSLTEGGQSRFQIKVNPGK